MIEPPAGEPTWTDYYEANDARPPRELLLEVLDRFPMPGDANDLGCGAGIDTLAMLERGWSVRAIDAEPEAIERLRRRAASREARLRAEVLPIEDVVLDRADLVWASYSLFFCDPDRFPALWDRIRTSVRPGGRFAGQLMGERDSWAAREGFTTMPIEAARALFDGWELERFDEEDQDGEACSGPKHWHLFHVVARNPV